MINKLGVRIKSFVLYGRSLVTSFATLLTDFFVCLKAIEFHIKETWSKGESPLNKMFAFTTGWGNLILELSHWILGTCPNIQALTRDQHYFLGDKRLWSKLGSCESSQVSSRDKVSFWSYKRRDKSNIDISAKKENYLLL